MSRAKKVPAETIPARYLSVVADSRDTMCLECNGVGSLRRGPQDYIDCPHCDYGRVPSRKEHPRSWCVIEGAMPACASSSLEDALLTFYGVHRHSGAPLPPRDTIPVWDGDLGYFTTLGATSA